MWELDHKESWVPKNWCFPIVVLEKTLESSLDRKEIKLVTLKGNQTWILTKRTDAEAPTLWLPDVKSWLIGKDLDDQRDGGKWRKGQQRMRWLNSITYSMGTNLSKLQEIVEDRVAWRAILHGVKNSWTQLSNWTIYTKKGKSRCGSSKVPKQTEIKSGWNSGQRQMTVSSNRM